MIRVRRKINQTKKNVRCIGTSLSALRSLSPNPSFKMPVKESKPHFFPIKLSKKSGSDSESKVKKSDLGDSRNVVLFVDSE